MFPFQVLLAIDFTASIGLIENVARRARWISTRGAAQNVHKLLDFAALIRDVSADNRMFDAMRNVIMKHLLFNATQSGPRGGDLRDNVDTVPIFFDHAHKAANLSFNPAQALQT